MINLEKKVKVLWIKPTMRLELQNSTELSCF